MSVKYQDYYEILGLKRDAGEKEIKAAYRKQARKWHPDLHPPAEKAEAEERFKKVNEAYEVLKDPDKRARYDRLGSRWKDGQDFQGHPDMDGVRFYSSGGGFGPGGFEGGFSDGGFSDFFSTIFGGGAPGAGSAGRSTRRGPVRGQDLEHEIELSLEEAYSGVSRSLRFSGSAVCSQCSGAGSMQNGICARCGGTGSVPDEKTLEVRVPAGVKEGSRIRLKGQGGSGLGEGAPRGDLFLKVRLKPHPRFRLNGSDIESDAIIRPEQALFGDRISVETLDGRVNMKVPAGSRSGSRLRLRGKGFPVKDGKRGDHYVRLNMDLPRDLTDEEKELYSKLRDLRQGGGEER